MAVFRTHKNQNYTVMSNYHLRDRSLSLKAVGLLSKMLSLPDDWDYNLKGLMLLTKDGESSVRSGLKELEEAGYLERHTERVKGRFVTVWDVHEVPVTSDEWVERPARDGETDNPAFDNPKDGAQSQLFPTDDEPAKRKGRKRFVKPTTQEVDEYIAKMGYEGFDGEEFCAFYESKGWKVGHQPMKDWRSACVTWQKKRNPKPKGVPSEYEQYRL